MLRFKQAVGTTMAVALVGAVATIAGIAVFAGSGPAGDGPGKQDVGADSRPVLPPRVETRVKTYYVGDLLISDLVPRDKVKAPAKDAEVQDRRWVYLEPLIEFIASTVARGTWSIRDAQGKPLNLPMDRDGRVVKATRGVAPGTPGSITPFNLSISLIIRHTPEVHEEVANLLRHLRRMLYFRDHPGEGDPDRADAKHHVPPMRPRSPSPPRRHRVIAPPGFVGCSTSSETRSRSCRPTRAEKVYEKGS